MPTPGWARPDWWQVCIPRIVGKILQHSAHKHISGTVMDQAAASFFSTPAMPPNQIRSSQR
jgi:hypothetical protein